MAAIGTFYPDKLDPMMAAIRQALVDTGETGSALAEFGAQQVAVVAADDTEQGIDAKIAQGMAKAHGLCVLLIAGSGKNPDKSCPGPRMTIAIEAQLYVSTRIRAKTARPPLELLGVLMKFFHQAQIRISGFPWYEELAVTGFDPLEDPDYTAYAIQIEREFNSNEALSMNTKTGAAADGQTTAPNPTEVAQPLQLHCKVLVNGMLYAGAHHALGKVMPIPKDKAEYLAGMNPPQVEIVGVV